MVARHFPMMSFWHLKVCWIVTMTTSTWSGWKFWMTLVSNFPSLWMVISFGHAPWPSIKGQDNCDSRLFSKFDFMCFEFGFLFSFKHKFQFGVFFFFFNMCYNFLFFIFLCWFVGIVTLLTFNVCCCLELFFFQLSLLVCNYNYPTNQGIGQLLLLMCLVQCHGHGISTILAIAQL
jgi:hypothetical protein